MMLSLELWTFQKEEQTLHLYVSAQKFNKEDLTT